MGIVYFVFLAIGTIGLLVGEFSDMSRAFTLLFAATNLIGLVGVGARLFRTRSPRT
jgi:hypothetical protein